jgi:large subunit ribosomal protein L25
MPHDIPGSIEVEVGHLDIGDQFRLNEITLPAGVTATIEPDALIAQVVAPRVAEVAEAAEGEGEEGEAVEGEAGEGAPAGEAPSGDEGGGE